MKDALEAFGRADVGPIFAALDDNVVWKSAALETRSKFRFGGEYRGRENVVALLSKISTAYFFSECETREVVSKGEIVWGHFLFRGRYAPVGTDRIPLPIVLEMALRWRIRDGRIVEAQTFFDTAGLLTQQGEFPNGGASRAA